MISNCCGDKVIQLRCRVETRIGSIFTQIGEKGKKEGVIPICGVFSRKTAKTPSGIKKQCLSLPPITNHKNNTNMKRHYTSRSKVLLLLLLAFCVTGFLGCTKETGCDSVGGMCLTGVFHYSKETIKFQKWPSCSTMLDVNAYIVKDSIVGDFYDTIVITKTSVPAKYRKDGEWHVAVSVENTVSWPTTMEVRRDFYRLLCIEKID